ncbi:MAG TPA: pentapeptide repeat-containing protein [Nocardioides sp.]|uniref:pentapeptide repeat-containing protein n=1 Tax=uncultured Nocardioides sp. TaxID=198441 RepID=UPI00261E5ABA|nr:pentapeptide repeat-containing protein [uncultured Nocardioides sp.]HRD60478.1 pentapeptide repeat-containing protein [Nocardioides sp.]HRI94455.1 pentapeptide repeat-containing protein [Nocardioides sp.]HRK45516.1 pentapeptide repeat-containing protein [Nocardioides sp.]
MALPFRESHGFAFAKDGGEPCRHLDGGYGCSIHAALGESGMVGCTAYECFGAGQHVTQSVYGGTSWRDQPDHGEEMFAVFAVVQRLHEMLVLLDQAAELRPAPDLDRLRERVAAHTTTRPAGILDLDLDRLTVQVGESLRAVSRAVRGDGPSYVGQDLLGRDLRGADLARADLRGALLIAADLRSAVLDRADLLGADLRDTLVAGADLSTVLFVTQPQLNAALGDATTLLPAGLRRPAAWSR